jgi:proteic killer suppression protein
VIRSFRNKDTEQVYERNAGRRFRAIEKAAFRRLVFLDSVTSLNDLRDPPGNRLEALDGDREGQFSIRINQQWRICFVWSGGHAYEVEIADYH